MHEFPYLLLTVCQDLAQRLGLNADLVSGSKHPASGPVHPGLVLKRVQKILDPARALESSAELFIGAGLARCPPTSTLPVSTACLASARVLKNRAAHSQMSRRTDSTACSMVRILCRARVAAG